MFFLEHAGKLHINILRRKYEVQIGLRGPLERLLGRHVRPIKPEPSWPLIKMDDIDSFGRIYKREECNPNPNIVLILSFPEDLAKRNEGERGRGGGAHRPAGPHLRVDGGLEGHASCGEGAHEAAWAARPQRLAGLCPVARTARQRWRGDAHGGGRPAL